MFTVRLDGTSARRVTAWKLSGGFGIFPEWSPDGRWILFHSQGHAGGPTRLWLVHPNGEGLRQITDSDPHHDWVWGSFSLDGTKIAAIRWPGETTENDLYVMNLEGTAIRPVTGSLATAIESAEGVPDWGPS
jgi:Tol biopolymer transport system component